MFTQVFRQMPLFIAAICLVLGLLLPIPPLSFLSTITLICLLFGCMIIVNRQASPFFEQLGDACILLICLFIGMGLRGYESQKSATAQVFPFDENHAIRVGGVLSGNVKNFSYSRNSRLKIFCYWDSTNRYIPLKREILLEIPTKIPDSLAKNDTIFAEVQLQGLEKISEGYRKYLHHNRIYRKGKAIHLIKKGQQTGFLPRIETIQHSVSAKFRSCIPDSTLGGIADAMFLGKYDLLDGEMNLAFQKAGVSHIMAISGQHITMIFMLLNALLFPMHYVKGGKRGKFMLMIGILFFYMFLCGASPSVVRSIIMFITLLVARLLRRRFHILNLLGAAAFVQLLLDPQVIYNVGFQLSYCAVASIVIFYPSFENYFLTKSKALNILFSWIGVTLTAQIFTFPLMLYHFGKFPTYFILSNVLLAPVGSLTVLLGFLLLMGCFIPLFNKILGFLTFICLWVMVWVVEKIAELPYAVIDSWTHPGIGILGITVVLTFGLLYLPHFFRKEEDAMPNFSGLRMWGLD